MQLADIVDGTSFWPIEIGAGQRIALPRPKRMYHAFRSAVRHSFGELPSSFAVGQTEIAQGNLAMLERPLWIEWLSSADDKLPELPLRRVDQRMGCLFVPAPVRQGVSIDACVAVTAEVGMALVLPVSLKLTQGHVVTVNPQQSSLKGINAFAIGAVRKIVPFAARLAQREPKDPDLIHSAGGGDLSAEGDAPALKSLLGR